MNLPPLAGALLLATAVSPLAAQSPAGGVPPAPPPPPTAAEFEQRVKILERKLELADEAATEKAKATPTALDGGDKTGTAVVDRETEQVVLVRFQLTF